MASKSVNKSDYKSRPSTVLLPAVHNKEGFEFDGCWLRANRPRLPEGRYQDVSGSAKIITQLDHLRHCKANPGTNSWTKRVPAQADVGEEVDAAHKVAEQGFGLGQHAEGACSTNQASIYV